MEYQEYKQAMGTAIANDDLAEIERLNKEWNKSKAERQKQIAEAERKEAEALAGDRDKLAKAIHKAVIAIPEIQNDLARVKAKGFTFKLDDAEEGITYKSVALTVPVPKTRRTGGGGGGNGKTRDEFGMSLSEVYDKFRNSEDDAKMADAETKDKVASEKLGKQTNSNQWRVKNEVKKRVIASGELSPQK